MIFFCCMAADRQIKERRVRSRRPTHLATQFDGLILVELLNFVKSRLLCKKNGGATIKTRTLSREVMTPRLDWSYTPDTFAWCNPVPYEWC